LKQALKCYEAAIALAPGFARAHLNRGNALLELDDFVGAIGAFETVLKLDPKYAGAHFNIGNAYRRFGESESARLAYSRAIALESNYVDAEVALGSVLDDLQQYSSAIVHYRRALALQPNYAQVHSNLGNVLRSMGMFESAVLSYGLALEINPDFAEAHNNLGNVLKDLGKLPEALACYRRALAIAPGFTDAHSSLLFLLNYRTAENASVTLREANNYGFLVTKPARCFNEWSNAIDPERSLRVGFVSGDFREHPVSYFLEDVLSALVRLAPEPIKIYGYSNHIRSDAATARIQSRCTAWCLTIEMSDAALATRIRQDAIDILIDLSGHTAHNRLPVFAIKPAPVQVSWLGYFGTTGVAAIDYLIADPWTLLPREEPFFTEKIWRLPETRLCFTPPRVSVAVSPLPATHNAQFTFGCFNNLSKMTEEVVRLWVRILNAVPGSCLFLKSPQLSEATVRNSVFDAFATGGIHPDRLTLEGLSSRAEYLASYQRVDISLDPFPYTGGTTTVESLWMGVPVITLQGTNFLSRQGVGLLMNAGLPDWIASDPDDYVKRAVQHAGDLSALANLRYGLRKQVLASPIFDAPRFARFFEAALRDMWRIWCDKQ
jgi:protein O-GlcNAc transferase